MTIKDEQGNAIEVTDLKAALEQAEYFVRMHEEARRQHDAGEDVLYHRAAHRHWEFVLKQLKKLTRHEKTHQSSNSDRPAI